MNSRRGFIKGIGLLSLSPMLSSVVRSAPMQSGLLRAKNVQLLSCNIRVALDEDEEKGLGWSSRRDICIKVIKSQKPDIICLQEVLRIQNEDLKKAFAGYFSFGFEGPEMDEFKEGYHGIAKNPIFFSTDRFELLAAGQYWLSDTPLIAGSKSWETARARQANWVRLKDKRTGVDFRVTNLHLDHISHSAREKQIEVVLAETKQYQAGYPQILVGDFNSGMEGSVYKSIVQNGWQDTYTLVNGSSDPGFTAHNFKGEDYTEKGTGKKIDFIFTKGPINTGSSIIIKDKIGGKYPSDHYFIASTLAI